MSGANQDHTLAVIRLIIQAGGWKSLVNRSATILKTGLRHLAPASGRNFHSSDDVSIRVICAIHVQAKLFFAQKKSIN
jgi:hypothetical protein